MNNTSKKMVLIGVGFFAGVMVAYVIAPSNSLVCLALGTAIASGTALGLFSDAFFAETRGLEAERKRAQEALRVSREFLQTVIDGIPEVTMVVNRDHRIVLANRAAREMARGEDPVARCLTCHQLSHHSNVPCRGLAEPCPLKQVVETKEPVTVTHTHYDPDDKETLVEVCATPVLDEAGEVVEMIEACRHIARHTDATAVLPTG